MKTVKPFRGRSRRYAMVHIFYIQYCWILMRSDNNFVEQGGGSKVGNNGGQMLLTAGAILRSAGAVAPHKYALPQT